MSNHPPEVDWSDPPEFDWPELSDPSQEPPPDEPTPQAQRPAIPPTPTADSASQANVALVLRHPDVAVRLTQPPLGHSRPEVWNGYIPAETWQGRHNDSPRRAALLAILTDALKADGEAVE